MKSGARPVEIWRRLVTAFSALTTCRQSRAAFSGLWKACLARIAFDGDESPTESADKSAHSKASAVTLQRQTWPMNEFGKILVVVGLVTAGIGVMLWAGIGKGWLGRLPGDIHYTKGDCSLHFPLVTCLLISAVLTLLLWLFRK